MTRGTAEISERVAGKTVPACFLETLAARRDKVALRWRDGEERCSLTFEEYADRAARAAAGLRELGVERGGRVVLMLRNRPEFHVADLGVLLAGATPISIYNSSSPEQIGRLVGRCRGEVAVVEAGDIAQRLWAVRDDLPDLRHVVVVDGDGGDGAMAWSELQTADPVDLERAAGGIRPDDLVTVIYTSGTTGDPKGVMLDHANICWTIESLRLALGFPTDGFRLVSYLPMAHIAERVVSHYSALVRGYEVTTCPDLTQLVAYLGETKPELFFGVPRTYEKLHSGIRAVLGADPARQAAFDRALAVGFEMAAVRARGEEPPPETARAFDEADAANLRPVRQLLGLDDVRVAVTAAAPIPVEILGFFRALGLPLSEMYGLTETSGPATWEPERVRPGTVGRPIPGVELRLAADGEIEVRGGNVFRGYLDDPERTAEALGDDGWLRTGDVGALDDDGYLRIVDRKKELIITQGGKNIAPAGIESLLKSQPLIGQACAIGDGQPYVVALLTLDPDVAPVWAQRHGVTASTLADLAADPTVLAEVAREVDDVNRRFSRSEQVRRFKVLGVDWVADSEELTPTMKLKRRGIVEKYATVIAQLYAGSGS